MKYLKIKIALILWFGIAVLQLQATDNVVTCDAYFTYDAYDGPNPSTGGITFSNLATGDFTDVNWDFGDGAFFK